MKLAPLLSPEVVASSLEARDRHGVLAELAGLLQGEGLVDPGMDLVTILENREELGSTGIGGGLAIPHVRLKSIPSLRVALGRSLNGVEFGAADGQPVHIFFLLLAPEEATGEHLKALAGISRLLKSPGVKEALLAAEDAGRMLEIIEREDEKE